MVPSAAELSLVVTDHYQTVDCPDGDRGQQRHAMCSPGCREIGGRSQPTGFAMQPLGRIATNG